MYWSNSENSENKIVKRAMSRDRFKTIKKCIHFGSIEDKEGQLKPVFVRNTICLDNKNTIFASFSEFYVGNFR
jgi:Transposase IS4